MSYTNKRRGARQALGISIDDLITNVTGAAGSAADIATDPYLPEVVCHLSQLKQINAGGAPSVCSKTAPGLTGGIGLQKAVVPMRAYVYAEQHKWVYPLAAFVLLGLPIWIGYELGKGKTT